MESFFLTVGWCNLHHELKFEKKVTVFSQQFEILSEKAALMEAEESKEKMFSNVDYT